MLRVWASDRKAGVLARLRVRGTSFACEPGAAARDAVSATMPVRPESWNSEFSLLPIFEMNLPEGALKERLRMRFAKALGRFDDLDVLGIVGRSQIGRLRYSGLDAEPDSRVPFQSVDEILKSRRSGALFDDLLDMFAVHSGISGVQPKLLVRDADGPHRAAVKGATHIVKFWGPEHKELAANEFFCLEVARRLGLATPAARLADDGGALVVERFDRAPDGGYRGFEDFCALNGHGADLKYAGGYEKKLFRRLAEFLPPARKAAGAACLYRLFVLNCALGNGDAHLKNFGIVYDDPSGDADLAPAYDIVTTQVYLPDDSMALALDGSTRWPDAGRLAALGRSRAGLHSRKIAAIFEATADAMRDVARDLAAYFRACPSPEIGAGICAAWERGIAHSLGLRRNLSSN